MGEDEEGEAVGRTKEEGEVMTLFVVVDIVIEAPILALSLTMGLFWTWP